MSYLTRLLNRPVSVFTSNANRLLCITAVAAALSAASSHAATTLSWSGGGGANANWNNSANWGFAGTPGIGDTLVFPAGQPNLINTNNIASLVLNQIRFAGAGGGYEIRGNAFTLTNSIAATNTAGANTISNNVTLATADVTVNVGSGSSLTLAGPISGAVGLTKTGPGTLTYSGPSANSYSGPTVVSAGLLLLGKTPTDGSINAGSLTISSATVREIVGFQLGSIPVTVNAGGLLDLNGFGDTIGNSLTLNGGGDVQTGAGTLYLLANNTLTAGTGSTISGNLSIGSGTSTWQINGTITISASVSGSASIAKEGGGGLYLNGANTFTGPLAINESWVSIGNATSLGTTNGATTVNNNAFLAIYGGIDVVGESLTLNSGYTGGALYVYGDTNTWTGTFTLNSNTTVQVFTNCALDLIGPISGTGGFTKFGPGRLVLSGSSNNDYSGATVVNEGMLELNKTAGWAIGAGSLVVGDGLGGIKADIVRYIGASGSEINIPVSITVKDTGWLDLNGHSDDVGAITLDDGQITTAAGSLIMTGDLAAYDSTGTNSWDSSISGKITLSGTRTFSVTNNLYVSAAVSGSYGLIKTGPGFMYLQSANAYTGLTEVRQGFLWINDALSLGTTANGTVVSNGASLVMSGAIGVTNETLTLNGPGVGSGWGALDAESSGTNLWVGPITVNGDSTIVPYSSSTHLRIIGAITGTGGVRKFANSDGTLYFEGNTANTYAGATHVDSGTLALKKTGFDLAIPGSLTIDGTVRLLNNNQIANTSDVSIGGTGLLDLNGSFEGIDALSGSGSVALGTQYLVVGYGDGSSIYDGLISGAGYLEKEGLGTIVLTANNTYAGATYVGKGVLRINGTQPQSPVTVASAGTLGGSGTVGIINASGAVAPGNSPGMLTSSNVIFTASGSFNVELAGPTPGTDYDQLNVRGTNALASATLNVTAAFTSPVAIGQQFVILNNDGSDLVSGQFVGRPEGSTFTVNNFGFRINYNAGSGNDVVLTLIDVPAAQGAVAVATGNGNHAIDPNECNFLNITISNKTATPMLGVSAVLSCSTPNVMINQPYSLYPNVPANGRSTNTTWFQISTLPGFPCGNDINLQLTVSTSSHGDFTIPVVVHTGEPATVASRYDNSTSVSIPDVGTVESTNTVFGFVGPVNKVTVALWITHTFDQDLSISLVGPDGNVVDLSSANGAGANFGAACSPDSSRTTFDAAAATSITAGVPPYVGTYRPEGNLAVFNGMTSAVANGDWRLQIKDVNGGTLGTLRCWSLFLSGTACAAGGGYCDVCLPGITGIITTNDLRQTNRWFRDGVAASCGSPKNWYGSFGDTGTNFHYDVYTFTNTTGADACVTVLLQSSGAVMAAGYLGSFDPANIVTNYAGDGGESTDGRVGGLTSFSCTVPVGARFLVTVNEVSQNTGPIPYTLFLSGIPCPQPRLDINPAAGNNVQLRWPNWAGGYLLEATPTLTSPSWGTVPQEPISTGGKYAVTNSSTSPVNRFYQLKKP